MIKQRMEERTLYNQEFKYHTRTQHDTNSDHVTVTNKKRFNDAS
jgi:hypothetical protein